MFRSGFSLGSLDVMESSLLPRIYFCLFFSIELASQSLLLFPLLHSGKGLIPGIRLFIDSKLLDDYVYCDV